MGQWLKQQGGHWIGFFKKMVVVSIFICFLSTYVVIFIDESRFYNIFFSNISNNTMVIVYCFSPLLN